MAVGTRRQRAAPDIWPGFVDAITALLIIMIFVLIVFALAQFFLTADLSRLTNLTVLDIGRNQLQTLPPDSLCCPNARPA